VGPVKPRQVVRGLLRGAKMHMAPTGKFFTSPFADSRDAHHLNSTMSAGV
jgi:hypothetical protein